MKPILDAKAQRETEWQQALGYWHTCTDRLGNPIDENILEMVTILNLLGFRSYQSCEGHLESGVKVPWVTFVTGEECPGYKDAYVEFNRTDLEPDAQEAAWLRLTGLIDAFHHEAHLYTKLSALLDAFYAQHKAKNDSDRLFLYIFEPGCYRLQAAGPLWWNESLSACESKAALANAQAEMTAFTTFLKDLYFAQTGNEIIHVQ